MKKQTGLLLCAAILIAFVCISGVAGQKIVPLDSGKYNWASKTYRPTAVPTQVVTPCPTCPITTPCPTCPTTPPCQVCPITTPCSESPVLGSHYHKYQFKIMVIDGIDENMVKEAVLKLPNTMGFEFVNPGTLKYHIYDKNYPGSGIEKYYGLVVPEEPYTVIVFDSEKNYPENMHNNDGMCFKNIHSISLCGSRFDTPEHLALYIYHEFMHFDEFTRSGDRVHDMRTNSEFSEWLPPGLAENYREDMRDVKNGISVDQKTIWYWEWLYYDYLYDVATSP